MIADAFTNTLVIKSSGSKLISTAKAGIKNGADMNTSVHHGDRSALGRPEPKVPNIRLPASEAGCEMLETTF